MNKILVVSPHPDDETLGAGGLLLKYKQGNNEIYWLNITDMKEEYGYSKELVEKRQKQIKEVKNIYRFDGFFNLELKPAYLEQYESGEIICKISEIINNIKPNMVILPNRTDAHSDHKIVFDWCYSCTKIFRYPYIKMILTMEILSETDFALPDNAFTPNFFVDITDYFEDKTRIMKIYNSEIGEHPFPRSIEAIESLAKLNGIKAGTRYAEAFKIIKFID